MTTATTTSETAAENSPTSDHTPITVTLKILRFNPDVDTESHWETYEVPAQRTDRLLNLLFYVKDYIDGTFSFRRSCAHGVCGSDAMQINGVNRLACKVLMKDLLAKDGKTTITVAPIKGMTTLKDLYVDMDPFFEAFRAVKPYLVNYSPEPTRERLQSQADRDRFDDTTKCILCACCTSSCPVYWNDGSYFGPAAIVNAHRFIFDSRDEAAEERLDILNDSEGVWRCRTTFNCTDACPRGIQVTKAIQEVKRALLFKRV
jgi:succinate dehydrogenase / fumarate reductase iron-sulfur subunit